MILYHTTDIITAMKIYRSGKFNKGTWFASDPSQSIPSFAYINTEKNYEIRATFSVNVDAKQVSIQNNDNFVATEDISTKLIFNNKITTLITTESYENI